MGKLISFGELNYSIFFPLIGGILKLISVFYTDRLTKELSSHPLINGLNEAIGMSLALIPFIVGIIKNRKNEERFKLNLKHFLLIICSFLIFLQKYMDYCLIHFEMTNLCLIDIIFFVLLSYLILGEKPHAHQFISFGVLFLCSGAFFYFFFKDNDITFTDIINLISSELMFCTAQVWMKYIFNIYDCSAWEVSTYEGIINLLIFLILLISFSYVEIDKKSKTLGIFSHIKSKEKIFIDNFEYFKNMSLIEFIIFFFQAIIRGAFNIFFLFTNKYFTPSHIIIILLSDEIYISLKIDTTRYVEYIITTCILYPIIYFSIFVFTEMIELNFCNLSKNARKNIRIRYEMERVQEEKKELRLMYRNESDVENYVNDEVIVRTKDKGREG